MSDIELTIQNCLKATQEMIEFLVRHKISHWADQFEQIAKALKSPDADKAVGLHKKIPKESIMRLFESIASKDRCESADDAAQLIKLTDEVTQSFAKLRTHVKSQAKKTSAAKTNLSRPQPKGAAFGATTKSRAGALAPRRSNTD